MKYKEEKNKKNNFSIKSFPWSPGIPWKVRKGKYVIPELPFALLSDVITNKNLVVCCFGGLLEFYYSLAILETFNNKFPMVKKSWVGNTNFLKLLSINGLAKPFEEFEEITERDLKRFPTPLFLDKNKRVYLNSLYNYLNRSAYYSSKTFPDEKAAIMQIMYNSFFPWDNKNTPKLRFENELGNFDDLIKSRGINLNKPTIMILPDETGDSIHEESHLSWNEYQIKSFASIASQKNYQVLVLTNQPHLYWGSKLKVIGYSLDAFFRFLPYSKILMSKDIDFNLIGLLYPNLKVIGNEISGPFSLKKNYKFLEPESKVFSDIDISIDNALDIIL